jgi:hypothetical protein
MNNNNNNAEDQYIKMDWSLETSEERVAKAEEIIANTPSEKLTPQYLDKMAEYITFPIDKKERIRGRAILTNNRMCTLNKRETSFEGLIGKLENGEDGLYNIMLNNDKNVILDPKKEITEEDIETIPGLKELVNSIENVKQLAKAATGRKKYMLIQQLKEMRQDQYVIRNAYLQPRHSRILTKILSKINLDEKITINEAGEVQSTGVINLYNPAHIVALLCNYSELKVETWGKFDADIHWMMEDLDFLIEKCLKEEYPLYYKLLFYKIDGKSNLEIQKLLKEEFGTTHTVEYISALWRKKIPKMLAEFASQQWLEWHFTIEERGKWKRCSRCGQIKLADPHFFSRNRTGKDGYYSICKKCRNKKK